MVLVIDNYDSFTYNLVQYLGELGAEVRVMRNDVVKSDIHSTDTHGFSEAVFAVSHLAGVSFAPRIKNLKKQNLGFFAHSLENAE